MEGLVNWMVDLLNGINPIAIIIIISMLPILELRGGLVAATLLRVPYLTALPICIVFNLLPIPFILLFIKQIFKWLRKVPKIGGVVDRLEAKAMSKSGRIEKYKFWGLVFFVGIPLPGTGAWTGSLVASLLNLDVKKSMLAILVGVFMAAAIVSVLSYGLLNMLIS